MQFNGANIGEVFDASANGGRVRFTRNVGNIVLDLNDVEAIDLAALGGADALTMNDLSGTDVTTIDGDLAATPGASAGDGAADQVIVNGSAGDDVVNVAGGAGLAADAIGLEAHGDEGDDVVVGGADDRLFGEAGDDVLIGGPGTDTLDSAPGNASVIQQHRATAGALTRAPAHPPG